MMVVKAIADSKHDKAEALLEIHDLSEETWLSFPVRLLRREVEKGEALEMLEEEARDCLDDEGAVGFALD